MSIRDTLLSPELSNSSLEKPSIGSIVCIGSDVSIDTLKEIGLFKSDIAEVLDVQSDTISVAVRGFKKKFSRKQFYLLFRKSEESQERLEQKLKTNADFLLIKSIVPGNTFVCDTTVKSFHVAGKKNEKIPVFKGDIVSIERISTITTQTQRLSTIYEGQTLEELNRYSTVSNGLYLNRITTKGREEINRIFLGAFQDFYNEFIIVSLPHGDSKKLIRMRIFELNTFFKSENTESVD